MQPILGLGVVRLLSAFRGDYGERYDVLNQLHRA